MSQPTLGQMRRSHGTGHKGGSHGLFLAPIPLGKTLHICQLLSPYGAKISGKSKINLIAYDNYVYKICVHLPIVLMKYGPKVT